MTPKQTAERLGELIESNFLVTENPEFAAFVAMMPEKYWAKYDLSAVRLGWEAADLLERIAWVPVSERLPEVGAVLVWLPKFSETAWAFLNSEKRFVGSNGFINGVTHWMPLPNPPSE